MGREGRGGGGRRRERKEGREGEGNLMLTSAYLVCYDVSVLL